jgi:hypothetical protein
MHLGLWRLWPIEMGRIKLAAHSPGSAGRTGEDEQASGWVEPEVRILRANLEAG